MNSSGQKTKQYSKSFVLKEKNQSVLSHRDNKFEKKNSDDMNVEGKLDHFQNIIDNMERALRNLTNDGKHDCPVKVNTIVPSLAKRESDFQNMTRKIQNEEIKLRNLEGILQQERHNLDIRMKKIQQVEKNTANNVNSIQEQMNGHNLSIRIINETINKLHQTNQNWCINLDKRWSEGRAVVDFKIESKLQEQNALIEESRNELSDKLFATTTFSTIDDEYDEVIYNFFLTIFHQFKKLLIRKFITTN
jgi:hypothetical protein